MFKLGGASGSFGDVSKEEIFGFKNRLMQRFTRKQVRFDDMENIIEASKAKSRKKTRKEPVWFYDNIYEMDEVDSKFENVNFYNHHICVYIAFYSQEVTFEELSPYITQLSFVWYELGQRLGLDPAKLDTIKFAIGTPEGRCQRMLELWLNPEDSPRPTWESFFTALKGGQSNAEFQVADDIYIPRSVKTVMEIIFSQAKNKEEDEMGWQAWNFLLSKAEGSESYCKAFLKVNGLNLLLHCNQLFTSDVQLKGAFFYILDAIVQYPELQSYLMRSDVMYACKGMLASKYYPMISFTAGSVIVRMAIDGNEVWGYLIPDREEMLNSLGKAIPKWNIELKMQDNFARGLQQLDYLVRAATNEDSRISHWGIWALANHCTTNGSTYCVQLRRTGQLALVEQLMQDAKTSQVQQLCTQVVNCCEEHKDTQLFM